MLSCGSSIGNKSKRKTTEKGDNGALVSPHPRGVLLFGGPGAGKSALARSLATAAGASLIVVSCPLLLERYFGDSEKSLRRSFAAARALAPCVLVLDDIDAIAGARGSVTGAAAVLSRLVTTLLNELDGVGGEAGAPPILVIATASDSSRQTDVNNDDDNGGNNILSAGTLGLDAALLRAGRLDVHIHIPAPTAIDRLAILQASTAVSLFSSSNFPQISFHQLSQITHDWTCAQIAALLPEAALRAVSESMGDGIAAADINVTHIIKAASTISSSRQFSQESIDVMLSQATRARPK